MRNWILALPLIIFTFAAVSCADDEKTDTTIYFETIATVTSGSDYPSFITDEGYTLNCSNEISTDTGTVFNVGERFYLYYALGDTTTHAVKTYPIQLYDFGKFAVKNYVTIEKDSTDKYFDQQIRSVYHFWISGNYMNLIFHAYLPRTTPNTYELVRIMNSENNTAQSVEPTVYFELRHNVAGINYLASELKLMCFNLNPLVTEFPLATKLNVHLKWVDTNSGNQTYSFVFVPKTTSFEAVSSMRKIQGFRTTTGILPDGL